MIRSLLARSRRKIASTLGLQAAYRTADAPTAAGLWPHGSDFLDDELFRRAYAAGKATGSWWGYDIEWRAYVVCWAALHGRSLPGDYVECGVHRGGYARMIAEYVDLGRIPEKKFYLVDTFCGIPDRYSREGSASMFAGAYDDCYDEVARTFSAYANAVLVRGIVPDILPGLEADCVCFLSIDLNCVEPSVAALEHFWPRMSPGAAIVLDDYNFKAFADQKAGLDSLAAKIGVAILSLPTGQGLLIKS
jgi:O-methyltransferase